MGIVVVGLVVVVWDAIHVRRSRGGDEYRRKSRRMARTWQFYLALLCTCAFGSFVAGSQYVAAAVVTPLAAAAIYVARQKYRRV